MTRGPAEVELEGAHRVVAQELAPHGVGQRAVLVELLERPRDRQQRPVGREQALVLAEGAHEVHERRREVLREVRRGVDDRRCGASTPRAIASSVHGQPMCPPTMRSSGKSSAT